jgi:pimeloyl-ACP methyl ester carboxylesterase
VLDTLVAGDLADPLLRASMPAAVEAALRGDVEALAVFGIGQNDLRLVECLLSQLGFGRSAAAQRDGGDSDAVYVATLCGDGALPWAADTPFWARRRIAEDRLAPISDFGPFDRATALASEALNVCKFWPEAGVPAPAEPPQLPTLVLAGADDLRTPLEGAKALADRIAGAQFVSIPDRGHSVIGASPCAGRALAAFMAGRPAAACQAGAQHSPKPLTRLQLRCFVYVSELSSARKHGGPPRLARCRRILQPILPRGLRRAR